MNAQLSNPVTPPDPSANLDPPIPLVHGETVSDVTELLTFQSGGRGYAVDIMSVREIRGWSEPTPLPHSESWLRGMVNLRGSVLPVMDLAHRLGRDPTEDDPRNVIIVIEEAGRVHGLLVQAVSDILRPGENQLQDVPATGADGEYKITERLFVSDDAMIQILSTKRLLERASSRSNVAP